MCQPLLDPQTVSIPRFLSPFCSRDCSPFLLIHRFCFFAFTLASDVIAFHSLSLTPSPSHTKISDGQRGARREEGVRMREKRRGEDEGKKRRRQKKWFFFQSVGYFCRRSWNKRSYTFTANESIFSFPPVLVISMSFLSCRPQSCFARVPAACQLVLAAHPSFSALCLVSTCADSWKKNSFLFWLCHHLMFVSSWFLWCTSAKETE